MYDKSLSGISSIYQISMEWNSDDAGCLQRLEVQSPHQKLRLLNDFTLEAEHSTIGSNYL